MSEQATKLPPIPTGGFDSFRDAVIHLRRPFAANAVRWKTQSTLSNNRGLMVPYMDARLVIERLNALVPHLWSAQYEIYGDRMDSGHVLCHLTIGDITRSDVGKGSGADATKAAHSDALKRAAVHFGIGVSLYATPKAYLNSSTDGSLDSHDNPTLRQQKKGDKVILHLTPKCEEYLAAQYAKWLDEHAEAKFGPALDHGDSFNSVGTVLEGEPASDDAASIEDTALASARQAIEKAYGDLPPAKRPDFPPQRFRSSLEGAETLDALQKISERVQELSNA
jgi:hypothetical protein